MNVLILHFLLFLLMASIFLVAFKSRQSKKIFIVVITIQCTIIVGLRDVTIGVDTERYGRHFYNTIQSISYIYDKSDKGYFILQKIFSIISTDFNMWLLFISLIIYTSLGIFIFRYSKNIFLSYLLYFSLEFFLFSFSGVRQSLATAIILISYIFIIEKKPWKFVITVLIATTIHSSALIFLPAYWLARKRITAFYLGAIFMTIFLSFIFRDIIGRLLMSIYYGEPTNVISLYESSGSLGGTFMFIILVLLFSFTFVYTKEFYHSNEEYKILTNIMLVSLVIQTMSSFIYLFTRLNHYYFIFMILYLPYCIFMLGKSKLRFTTKGSLMLKYPIYATTVLYFTYYYFEKLKFSAIKILPYKFFWQ